MRTNIRGIRCEISSCIGLDLERVLKGLPLEAHKLLYWGMLTYHDRWLDSKLEEVRSDFIAEISGRGYVIWEMYLHIFPKATDPKHIDNYEEFLESPCRCSVLYYDCGYLEIYVKDVKWREIILNNLRAMETERIDLITDENDDRTGFI